MTLFRQPVPTEWLFDLLDSVCDKKENSHYCFDTTAYQKMLYHKLDQNFMEKIQSCYHDYTQFYIQRKLTYKSFVTIIRQICKHHQINFYSKTKFYHSDYQMEYYIKGNQDGGNQVFPHNPHPLKSILENHPKVKTKD